MPTLGERIKARRVELGWTQETLAAQAQVSKGFLSDLENGNRGVSAEKLLDIARELQLSLDFLMTGTGSEPPSSQIQVPTRLSEFANKTGLSFRQVLVLLDMRRQIVAHRSSSKSDDVDDFDWMKFYHSVKGFLP